MAITPRSFTMNPALLVLLGIALSVAGLAWLCGGTTCQRDSAWTPSTDCAPGESDIAQWTEMDWGRHIHCLMERDRGDEAYRAASQAVKHYPRSAALLNLRGFVAGRNGEHAIASHDFSIGKRVTGSPSGVFENNIAWSALWQLEGLEPVRAERVLLQSRSLYEQSLGKRWSCERAHTGLFVEYALADLKARSTTAGRTHPDVKDAVRRYSRLHAQYQSCYSRIHRQGADDLVVEEVLSAAVVDQAMGHIAGVRTPTRHIRHFEAALDVAERNDMSRAELCEKSMPVVPGRKACEAMMR